LIEYFSITFLSTISYTSIDFIAIGYVFGGFLTFIALKKNLVPLWIIPEVNVTVAKSLPVGK